MAAHPDQWKWVSHLQKAIRRGHVAAARTAVSELWGMDKNYLKYRMATIAVEDVMAGSPELLDTQVPSSWRKADLEALGGQVYMENLAASWAGARKDRTPCDWIDCRHWLADFEAEHGRWDSVPAAEATELAWDRSSPWWMRGLAAWRAAGTQAFPSDELPVLEGDPEWWTRAASETGRPTAALEFFARQQREPHPVFVALAWEARAREPRLEVNTPIAEEFIGPWLAAAIDGHTSEGKKALRRLWTQRPLQAEFAGVDDERAEVVLKKLWFWLDGGLTDKSWNYPTRQRMLADSRARFQERLGIHGSTWFQAFGQPASWRTAQRQALGLNRPRP
jgi:hypothetical protein